MVTFSIVIPTIGRATLKRTLESVIAAGCSLDDEVLVVGDGERAGARAIAAEFRGQLPISYFETPPTNAVGGPQRMAGLAIASRSHFLTFDDDDAYKPGAIELMRRVAEENPGKIIIFRMHRNPPRFKGDVLWQYRDPFIGNIGTPMMVVPRIPHQLGLWSWRPAGDYDFLQSTLARWPGGKSSIVWREEITCEVY